MKIRIGIATLAALSTMAFSTPIGSNPIVVGGVTYSGMGSVETVVAPFVSPSVGTTGTYSGLVELVITGAGFSSGPNLNDAIYGFTPYVWRDYQYYQLNIGWTGAPLSPLVGNARNIDNFVRWSEGTGDITNPSQIPYNPTHEYHFVVAVTGSASPLSFGVSDGIFSDNGGAYTIQVLRLTAQAAVPEPGTMALFGLGILGLCFRNRAFRSKK